MNVVPIVRNDRPYVSVLKAPARLQSAKSADQLHVGAKDDRVYKADATYALRQLADVTRTLTASVANDHVCYRHVHHLEHSFTTPIDAQKGAGPNAQ